MEKILVIIKREYMVRVRTRAFVILTILSPILMLALVLLPGLLATRGGGERKVTVLDQSGDSKLFEAINKKLESRASGTDGSPGGNIGTRYTLSRKAVPPGEDAEAIIAQDYQQGGEKDSDRAYLILPPNIFEGGKPEY